MTETTAVQHVTQKLPAPFGKYLLTDLLAIGGMAEVYRAKIFGASDFEKEMVVKRILPRFAQNPSFVQMLIDEAKIAVSLTHGNIVPIYELGELEGSYYIAMEYVEGKTLLDVLRDAHTRQSSIPWSTCLHVAAEVARGLAYAHSRKDSKGAPLALIHRDINPRNIVITASGEVKVLDFGIARASTKRHQTASGVIKGTPGYMSPEQMYGQSIDQRTDIYCLGILLFELLTLRRLFPVWDVTEMRQVFEAGPIPAVSTLCGSPAALDAIVLKALAPRADDRYQSAQDFEEALRQALASSGQAVTSFGLARELRVDTSAAPAAPTALPLARTKTPLPHATPAPHIPTLPLAAGPMTPGSAMPRLATPEATVPGVRAHVKTSPMQPRSAVFELHDRDAPPVRAPAPLPASRPAAEVTGNRTTVLARNDDIGWSRNIGADAEMLVLAKAMGVDTNTNRRTAMVLTGLGMVALMVGALVFKDDITATVNRAIKGEQVEMGTMIIKTRPAGADVTIDGERKGLTSLKLRGIDLSKPHRLVVTPKDKGPIVIEVVRNDFELLDGEPTYTWERDFTVSAPVPSLPGSLPSSP
jgi:serine/threonine protein kinase